MQSSREPFASQIMRRNWNWIGHTLGKSTNNMTKKALTSNLQGREEDPERLYLESLRQKCKAAVTLGRTWRRQPRAECAWAMLSMAYAAHEAGSY